MSTEYLKNKQNRNTSDKEIQNLPSCRICDLEIEIKGTRLEILINQLHRELDQAGILFKPETYLSDGWGCPQNIPAVGIPFYLADPKLCQLEACFTDIEAENEEETMMYLRHEAGHAFNYAYRLYDKVSWQRTFGRYLTPYREEYQTRPFSTHFVRHVPGWYAQKHPDEDFAESFAVWLTPGAQWQERYAGTAALAKLKYIERAVQRYGQKPPAIKDTHYDKPLDEIHMTLNEWHKSCHVLHHDRINLPDIIDEDLRRLFPAQEGLPAADSLEDTRKLLLREVNRWTGIDRHLLRSLFDELAERTRKLHLKIPSDETKVQLASISAFLTAMAMNYQVTGQFIEV